MPHSIAKTLWLKIRLPPKKGAQTLVGQDKTYKYEEERVKAITRKLFTPSLWYLSRSEKHREGDYDYSKEGSPHLLSLDIHPLPLLFWLWLWGLEASKLSQSLFLSNSRFRFISFLVAHPQNSCYHCKYRKHLTFGYKKVFLRSEEPVSIAIYHLILPLDWQKHYKLRF